MCRSVPQADALAQVPGPSWIENVIIGDYPPRFYRLQQHRYESIDTTDYCTDLFFNARRASGGQQKCHSHYW